MQLDPSRKTTDSPKHRVRLSLRFVASLAAAGLVTITVMVTVWFSEQNMRQALIEGAQSQLILEARNLAITSSDVLLGDYPELTLMPMVNEIQRERQEIQEVVISNHEGKIQGSGDPRSIGKIWHQPDGLTPILGEAGLAPGERLSQTDQIILAECPIHYNGSSDLGWVAIVQNKRFIKAHIRQYRLKLLSVSMALLVVAVVFAAFVMSSLFRPIARLQAGLKRIGRGDLDSPMLVEGSTELSLLADTVNTMAGQLKTSQNLARAREAEITETQKELIVTLGQVVESRSSETANHTIRVGDMSRELALLAGLEPSEAELIRVASPMHDVGKIGIPDSILNKPGKLTEAEYDTMKNHATIGFNIMNKSERELFKAAAIIAHEHHERWDGKGYPRGIKGENIHVYGRIVGLVDVFDAIFSDRVYRKAMPLDKALGIIRDGSGSHFDPYLAHLFLENTSRFLTISERYDDSNLVQPEVVSLATEVVSI